MKITIIHDKILSNAPDALDNLEQANHIEQALTTLGHQVEKIEFSTLPIQADLIFNLVESIDGAGKNIYFAPAFFDLCKIPYTGCNTEAMYLTSNKILTKIILEKHGLPTPKWFTNDDKTADFKIGIAKSCFEDASFNLTDSSIIESKNFKPEFDYFCEEFIDGREINVSVIEIDGKPQVLPVAEIVFTNFSADKPKIIGYKAKWDTESFEYKNTNRQFVNDLDLKNIALKVWQIFGLSGYARIDFRVAKDGTPYILEINANPCIAPDAGFFAACQKSGMTYKEMVKTIAKI